VIRHGPDGRDSGYAGLAELRRAGYLEERIVRGAHGRIVQREYVVYEMRIPTTSTTYSDFTSTRHSDLTWLLSIFGARVSSSVHHPVGPGRDSTRHGDRPRSGGSRAAGLCPVFAA
jgi:hypothetical protein